MTDRIQFHTYRCADGQSTFADDVRRGLTSRPKFLLPKYFYDALGSHLFAAICHLPEYYPTRTELGILSAERGAIVEALDGTHRLIELGSGSSVKTRLLIEALLDRQAGLHYLPIDISQTALEGSAESLLQSYPGLRITAFAADYSTALDALAGDDPEDDERTLLIFLGSSIGNIEPHEARQLLRKARRVLSCGDSLLLGADLKKSSQVLVPAYDDALGVTAAFNLNLLVRINRELGGEFRLDRFQHRAIYNEDEGRIELYLVSEQAQEVPINALDVTARFAHGEHVHTENSYKFDPEQLRLLAARSGFDLFRAWYDDERKFSLNLFRAADEDDLF